MAATTVNIALAIPTRGSDVGVWDTPVNGDFNAIDGFTGGVQTIGASNSNIVLTAPAGAITPSGGPTQAQNKALKITGTLTGNVQITLPLPGDMIIHNLTTGAFVVTFAAAASGQVIGIEQGTIQRIYNDGTNVYFVGLEGVGTYRDICDATVPAWITACTVPPFLNCTGATFNATTYPYLNAKLGGNTLPDLRGIARYTLNQGTSRITSGVSGLDGDTRFSIKTSQANTIQTSNLPPYTPSGGVAVSVTTLSGVSSGVLNSGSVQFLVPNGGGNQGNNIPGLVGISASGSFSGTAQGGTSTPFPAVATGTISGITLIRAA